MAWIYNGVEFNTGDRVRVMRQEEDLAENGMGEGKEWDNTWVDVMDLCLGLEFEIQDIGVEGVSFVDDGYCFPLTSLDKVVK